MLDAGTRKKNDKTKLNLKNLLMIEAEKRNVVFAPRSNMKVCGKQVYNFGENQVYTMDLKEIENYIKEALPNAVVEIQDLAGDGNHYSATVTATEFSGKSKIEQHKMVYNSLKGKMGNELHALAIKTKEK